MSEYETERVIPVDESDFPAGGARVSLLVDASGDGAVRIEARDQHGEWQTISWHNKRRSMTLEFAGGHPAIRIVAVRGAAFKAAWG